jgi:hypothetical protein
LINEIYIKDPAPAWASQPQRHLSILLQSLKSENDAQLDFKRFHVVHPFLGLAEGSSLLGSSFLETFWGNGIGDGGSR